MEKSEKKKCSLKEHSEIGAINFCVECKIYMCKNCFNYHSKLLQSHHTYDINEKMEDIFTGFCKEENHGIKLEFYCKTHNILCCAGCICKMKEKGYGIHKDCETYIIENIKEEKKNKLVENMKKLEVLSKTIEESIKELKNIFESVGEEKEKIKIKIQKIFTKLRTELDNREEQLLIEVDQKYEDLYFKEGLIKISEKLPKKIQSSLNNGKNINKYWDDNNKLCSLINDCINIEKNIEYINEINKKVLEGKKYINLKIKFSPEEIQKHSILEQIKSFGIIFNDSYKYIFKKCPDNIKEKRTFIITGENGNIMTRVTPFNNWNWRGTTCLYELKRGKIYKWKISILKTKHKYMCVGIATNDFVINQTSWHCGYYLECSISSLCSGPPHNYNDYKGFNLPAVKDEVILIMDMDKRTLKFIINNEDRGDQYTNIPIDKPLFPAVLLVDQDDTIEITDFEK